MQLLKLQNSLIRDLQINASPRTGCSLPFIKGKNIVGECNF